MITTMDINRKKARVLICWLYDLQSPEFLRLMKEINVDYCGYFQVDENEIIENPMYNPIYLYQNLEYYKKGRETFIPLDEKIIKEMYMYEQQAMDIIYRWRRSYTNKETYNEIKDMYYIFLAFWNNYLLKNKINCLILTVIPHIPVTFIPYALCKIYGIPIIILNNLSYIAGEKGNYFLQSSLDQIDDDFNNRLQVYTEQVEKGESLSLNGQMKRYMDTYFGDNKEIKRVIGYNQKKSVKKRSKQYIERILIYVKRKDYSILFNKMKSLLGIKVKEKRFLKKIEMYETLPAEGEKFFLFPLHMQPEATTLPSGGVFADQLLAIKMISSCLEDDTYLYVKEHPVYWSRKGNLESIKESRNIDFYKTIISLRNVKLIKHNYSSLDLIDKCMAIATITGTAGFESIFKMKPVLIFGDIYYNKFKSIYNIRTVEQCKKAITGIIHNDTIAYTKNDIMIYLKALEKYMVTLGSFDPASIDNGVPKLNENDKSNLVDSIIRYYKDFYENKNL